MSDCLFLVLWTSLILCLRNLLESSHFLRDFYQAYFELHGWKRQSTTWWLLLYHTCGCWENVRRKRPERVCPRFCERTPRPGSAAPSQSIGTHDPRHQGINLRLLATSDASSDTPAYEEKYTSWLRRQMSYLHGDRRQAGQNTSRSR